MQKTALYALCFFIGGALTNLLTLPTSIDDTKSNNADQTKVGVARIWHGKTPNEKTDEYTKYLTDSGITKLRSIKGNLGVQMFRQKGEKTTEYYVISYWPSREEIRAYAGDDIEKTRDLPRDDEYLIDKEPKVRHFDVMYNEWGQSTGR